MMKLWNRVLYFIRWHPILRSYWKWLGPHSQWRLNKAKRNRFDKFAREHGYTKQNGKWRKK